MNNKLTISVSPHIHSGNSTTRIMLDVIIALLPTSVAGVILFGWRALALIAVCIAAAVLSEFVFNICTKKGQTISDLSAVVTGLLLALNLSANVPLWQAAVGSVFAIVVVKCIFGGIGQNFANPAITARVFMIVAFTSLGSHAFPKGVDATSGATPLVELSKNQSVSLMDLFLGRCGGAIGEVCALALIVGGIYLLIRRVISWHTPVAYVGAVFVFSLIFEKGNFTSALAWVLSGGLLIGAIFMATDYATSPTTRTGKMIFGVGCALITVLIRFFGSYPEGVSFAILFMNILTPYIEKLTARKPFGGALK